MQSDEVGTTGVADGPDANSTNNDTAKNIPDGSSTIHFGGDPKAIEGGPARLRMQQGNVGCDDRGELPALGCRRRRRPLVEAADQVRRIRAAGRAIGLNEAA